jgi:oligopeptide transport system substrate-binding protein
LREGKAVPLTPKVYQVLVLLVQNSGHMLGKEELLRAVWPDSFVEEGNLTRNISTLRAALGESPEDHQYIETIPKRGYRFVASIRILRDESGDLLAAERPRAHINIQGENENGAGILESIPELQVQPPRVMRGKYLLHWPNSHGRTVLVGFTILVIAITTVVYFRLFAKTGEARKTVSKDNEASAYFGVNLPPKSQVMRYTIFTEPETLDPQISPDSPTSLALFDGLVEYKESTTDPRPSLAERWDVNADCTVWTFHLRHDAKWSDGELITAKDFVYSWRRALSPDVANRNAYLMYKIKNAEPYNLQSAYIYDPVTGKYAVEADLEHARKSGQIVLTGREPLNFTAAHVLKQSSSVPRTKYLLVPADEKKRQELFAREQFLSQITKGKKLVPVTQDSLGVRSLDDYTIEVILEEPAAYFIKEVLDPVFRPVPRQSIEKWGDTQWAKPGHIITSGAFILSEWMQNQRIVVARNTLFWDNTNTNLDGIVFLITEPAVALDLYKAGNLDATGQIPMTLRKQLEDKKDYLTAPFLSVFYLSINTTMPPFNDVHVRQALSMAINRQNLADQIGYAQPLTGFVPLMVGYEVIKGTGFNPLKARELLSAAGFPEGRGFPTIEMLFYDYPSNRHAVEAAQGMLQNELGIQVKLVAQNLRSVRSSRAARSYKGLVFCGWTGDYVDPSSFLGIFAEPGGANDTGWWDPRLRELLRTANAEKDPDRRGMLLRHVEKLLLEAQPVIPLYLKTNSLMRKPYVTNFESNLLDRHDWRGVHIDSTAAY